MFWGGHFKWQIKSQWKQLIQYIWKKKKKKKEEISAFRQNVLNCIYLTFVVPFQFKFVIFYEWDVYFGTLNRCWNFYSNLQKLKSYFPDKDRLFYVYIWWPSLSRIVALLKCYAISKLFCVCVKKGLLLRNKQSWEFFFFFYVLQ